MSVAADSDDFSWSGVILEIISFHMGLGLIFKQMQHCQ